MENGARFGPAESPMNPDPRRAYDRWNSRDETPRLWSVAAPCRRVQLVIAPDADDTRHPEGTRPCWRHSRRGGKLESLASTSSEVRFRETSASQSLRSRGSSRAGYLGIVLARSTKRHCGGRRRGARA